MFALYYEEADGRLIWIAGCHDIRSARNIAQVYSTGSDRPVVTVLNSADGTTTRCSTHHNGQETLAGDMPPPLTYSDQPRAKV